MEDSQAQSEVDEEAVLGGLDVSTGVEPMDFFEVFFAGAYEENNDQPITEKQFQMAIEDAKEGIGEGFTEEDEFQSKLLFENAKKEPDGRVSKENLIAEIMKDVFENKPGHEPSSSIQEEDKEDGENKAKKLSRISQMHEGKYEIPAEINAVSPMKRPFLMEEDDSALRNVK